MSTAATGEPRLLVAERFGIEQPTFQGEGPSCGTPALFIRLSRCNLTCTWCDTPYTWDRARFDLRTESSWQLVRDLASWARSSVVELVVITGGEPLIQQRPLAVLVQGLLAAGKRVEFETNGTIAPDPGLLVEGVRFNVSPKLANAGVTENKRLAPGALEAFAASGRAIFKFVTRSVGELEEIDALTDRYGLDPVYVMPEGTTVDALVRTTRHLAEDVAARRWHLTPRLHVLAFEEARGR